MTTTPRITLINVAGLCHGPEKYARSPIHRRVTNILKKTSFDIKTVFVPSAEIQEDKNTFKRIGIQLPPCDQLHEICNVVKTAIQNSRIPIALAHSSGSISTIAALQDNSLQNAVIISPTFLDPIKEIFDSLAFKRRLIPVDQSQSDYQVMISPTAMNYSTMFPSDHFSDHLYMDPIIFSQDRLKKIIIDKINHSKVDQSDIDRVEKVLRSGFLSKPEGGPVIEEFQKLMATAHNKTYAFGVTNGTSALHCAISALELRPGDEVIVPALANIADCSVVIQEGGVPIFTDIDSHTFNIDPEKIEQNITSKTRAIIVVHMYGQPIEIERVSAIAKRHNLVLIEDCAQAAGAKYKGRYVGSFGDISCFSLYQTKHIICGEGGVVMTSNDKFAKIITSIANNGIVKERLDNYDYDCIGYNYQLTEIQGALAIGQFKRLDKNNIERRKNVEKLKVLLSEIDIEFQHVLDETENSYFYLTALLPEYLAEKRDEFLSIVDSLDVPIKKLYPLALTEITLLKDKVEQNCPIAQSITKRIFNFYVNPGLASEDIEFMANAVIKAYQQISKNG